MIKTKHYKFTTSRPPIVPGRRTAIAGIETATVATSWERSVAELDADVAHSHSPTDESHADWRAIGVDSFDHDRHGRTRAAHPHHGWRNPAAVILFVLDPPPAVAAFAVAVLRQPNIPDLTHLCLLPGTSDTGKIPRVDRLFSVVASELLTEGFGFEDASAEPWRDMNT